MRVSSFQTNSNFSTLHTARFSFMASTSQNRLQVEIIAGFTGPRKPASPFLFLTKGGFCLAFFARSCIIYFLGK